MRPLDLLELAGDVLDSGATCIVGSSGGRLAPAVPKITLVRALASTSATIHSARRPVGDQLQRRRPQWAALAPRFAALRGHQLEPHSCVASVGARIFVVQPPSGVRGLA